MPFMPFQILGIWFRGLLSIAILAGGIYVLSRWYDESRVADPDQIVTITEPGAAPRQVRLGDAPEAATITGTFRRTFRPEIGRNRPTAFLAGAVALLTWAFLGSLIARGLSSLLGLLSKPKAPSPTMAGEVAGDPKTERGGEVHEIRRHDGTVLRVECYGPPDAQPVVLTHGWGADSTAWYYTKVALAKKFRLIVWDEPGLGLSKKPDSNDYRLEKLAGDLGAVLTLAGGRPAVLVGHSIGGMINLTFCKEFPTPSGRGSPGSSWSTRPTPTRSGRPRWPRSRRPWRSRSWSPCST